MSEERTDAEDLEAQREVMREFYETTAFDEEPGAEEAIRASQEEVEREDAEA